MVDGSAITVRSDRVTAGPVTPPPPTAVQAQAGAAPVSTKITMTDYGYVVGELRRIALLTLLLLVMLFVMWLVLR